VNLWQKFETTKENECMSLGISLHFQDGIEPKLRENFISFTRWLRLNYIFPVHINVHIINAPKIRLMNGTLAYGGFKWFPQKAPIIRIAAAIEKDLLTEYTKEEIYEQILSSLVHELTHYYQWILKLNQSNATSERQANYFRYRIIDKYTTQNR